MMEWVVEEEKLFSWMDGYIWGRVDEGVVDVRGKGVEGVCVEEGEEGMWKELEKMKRVGVREEEVEKVKKG